MADAMVTASWPCWLSAPAVAVGCCTNCGPGINICRSNGPNCGSWIHVLLHVAGFHLRCQVLSDGPYCTPMPGEGTAMLDGLCKPAIIGTETGGTAVFPLWADIVDWTGRVFMPWSELSPVRQFRVTGCCKGVWVAAMGQWAEWTDWPHVACGVHCHGDHLHPVCLIHACRTTDLSHTMHPVHWWAPAGCVSSVGCRNCVSRWHLILTWTICSPGRLSGRSAADRFCGELAPAGLASTVTSSPKEDGSPGLVSELVARDLSEDVWFPEEMAPWLLAVVKLWEPATAQLSAVVRLSEPA